MRLALSLVFLSGCLGLSACSDDDSKGSVNVDALVQERTQLQAQLKPLIDRAQELSNAVIPARNAWLSAKSRAGGDESGPEVVAAKQAFDEATATYQSAYDARKAVEAKIEDLEARLRKAGWKP